MDGVRLWFNQNTEEDRKIDDLSERTIQNTFQSVICHIIFSIEVYDLIGSLDYFYFYMILKLKQVWKYKKKSWRMSSLETGYWQSRSSIHIRRVIFQKLYMKICIEDILSRRRIDSYIIVIPLDEIESASERIWKSILQSHFTVMITSIKKS